MLRLPDMSVRFGAPMGRPSAPVLNTSEPVVLWPVAVDDEGYDSGGAYWGLGDPLWAAVDCEGCVQFTRAATRNGAVKSLSLMCRPPTGWEVKEHFDLESMLQAYLETALWYESLDSIYTVDDLDADFISCARADCEAFIRNTAHDLARYEAFSEDMRPADARRIGADLWLSNAEAGVGFCDWEPSFVSRALCAAAANVVSVDIHDALPDRED